jgi:hypothetical protein
MSITELGCIKPYYNDTPPFFLNRLHRLLVPTLYDVFFIDTQATCLSGTLKMVFTIVLTLKVLFLRTCNLINTMFIILSHLHHVTGNASPEVSRNETYSPYITIISVATASLAV